MSQAKAIALKTTPHSAFISKLQHITLAIGEFMYGSKERTWITLAVAFGMLVLGIDMMQTAANGGFCAAQS